MKKNDDLIRREAVMDALDAVAASCSRQQRLALSRVLDKVITMPAADAVPVVRCRDCKSRGAAYACPFRRMVHTEGRGYHYVDMTTDAGYCSFGMRKEAGT